MDYLKVKYRPILPKLVTESTNDLHSQPDMVGTTLKVEEVALLEQLEETSLARCHLLLCENCKYWLENVIGVKAENFDRFEEIDEVND